MAKFCLRIGTNIIVFLAAAYLFPGMLFVNSIQIGIIAGFFLAIINTIIKPIVSFFSFPITFMTLGLFLVVINAGLLELSATWVNNFMHGEFIAINGFGSALVLGLIFSTANLLVQNYFQRRG
ncbi:phage holin family protein [Xylocopilactobacillus apicola]|uniref:Membrane protein n=1 Tax=Xylocopilactobacillus apicola TaxID=2932184 RepID=A0AAU9D913_9LACO|nr:phage holin family protein [Xylocopilactobacillus apicola]BDR57955.1 membrane protein [Xylocopilactobacillus apicola]